MDLRTSLTTALTAMQAALDITPSSPHPTNKIAACLFDRHNNSGELHTDHSIFRTNHWPARIEQNFGTAQKIGNSSGTIHAETNCILNSSFATEGSTICITDPFCPNCAKNMAEAGIKNIYIDQNGFDKDFFNRRSGSFETMSMQICEKAGINVFSLDMKTKEITSILEIPDDYIPVEDNPIEKIAIETINDEDFNEAIKIASEKNKNRKISVALVSDQDGNHFSLTARAHAVVGYSLQKPDEALDLLTPIGKYSFIQEPVNRLMMHIKRKGYILSDCYLYCSQVPTSREQVNLIGADINHITIGDAQKCRDPEGLKAMKALSDAKIMDYS